MRAHRLRPLSFALLTLALLTTGLLPGCGRLEEPPAGYAIVYGVSDYYPIGSSYNDLTYPDDDADDIAAMLASHGYTVIARTNGDATKEQLEGDFATVAGEAGAGSRFFFYFAGHGFGDGMESQYSSMPPEWQTHFSNLDADGEPDGAGNYAEYLFLHNATPIDGDVMRSLAASLSDDELGRLLASVSSLQQIVVIDACHSGGFIGTASSYDSVPRNFEGDGDGVSVADALSAMTLYLDYDADSFADIPDRQAIVISAAGEQEFSYESAFYGNGIFTHHFLKAPASADRNYDGYVTANEAYAYASAAIAQVENDYFWGDGKFLPRVSGGAVDFVLFETE